MSKIPTAEEFYKQTTGCTINHGDVKTAMIEFAKLHVEAALKAASEKATSSAFYSPDNDGTYDSSVHKSSILNAYPLENIK